ncbi:hypothetical protein [Stutzerimonas stutzeri]|uniref:hypothetical protein n=1 Tax=Stutzerimonas stutzeri TaxID=316 RepID=UPI000F794E7F|nr:hypothetical protein [Stutzerimonas stutzeri]RSH68223.1 hypothetical protein EGV02_10185 [Stutzerimonas stutzeri]
MSEQVQIVELVEGKHWRVTNDLGEPIEVDVLFPDGSKLLTELAPGATIHVIPSATLTKIDVIYRRLGEGPRLRLV